MELGYNLYKIKKERVFIMNIRPVSDLNNYSEVLKECENGEPIYLTKNGRGKYVVVDIKDYEKQKAILKLMNELSKVEGCTEYYTEEEIRQRLGIV